MNEVGGSVLSDAPEHQPHHFLKIVPYLVSELNKGTVQMCLSSGYSSNSPLRRILLSDSFANPMICMKADIALAP
ncbi:hypothetical protein HKD37_13G037518 [Glycine soja]